MLGFADDTYWCNLERYHGFSKPEGPASESIGLNFYGDEGQIFDQSEYVCVNWGSELTPFPTNSRYSRFLIGMVPSAMCWKTADKVNVTIRELLRPIMQSFKTLATEGSAGLHGVLVSCKGDWKWLVQSLHLRSQPSTDSICWQCGATKSMACPFTDMSDAALWRTTPPIPGVHVLDPMIAQLPCPPIISLDAMHIFHLGVGRDLAASALLLLLRSNFYNGRKAGFFLKVAAHIVCFLHILVGRRSHEECD